MNKNKIKKKDNNSMLESQDKLIHPNFRKIVLLKARKIM